MTNAAQPMRVRNTDVGLSADFESRRGQSLDLQMAYDLARPLEDTLVTECGPGAAFNVSYSVDKSKSAAHPA